MIQLKNGCISKIIVSFHFSGNFPLNHDYGRKDKQGLPYLGHFQEAFEGESFVSWVWFLFDHGGEFTKKKPKNRIIIYYLKLRVISKFVRR